MHDARGQRVRQDRSRKFLRGGWIRTFLLVIDHALVEEVLLGLHEERVFFLLLLHRFLFK
jgi:hypothetical protein